MLKKDLADKQDLYNKSQKLKQDQETAEAASRARVETAATAITDAETALSNQKTTQKTFWEVSSTGEKISAGLNLLAALAYASGRNPEKGIAQADKTAQDMNKVVDNDIKAQERNREVLKEALMRKTNDFGRVAGWEMQKIALDAAKTNRSIDNLSQNLGLLAAKDNIPLQMKNKFLEQQKTVDLKKEEFSRAEAKRIADLGKVTTTTKTPPAATGGKDMGQLAELMSKSSAMVENLTKKGSMLGAYQNAKLGADKMDAILKAPPGSELRRAGSATIAEAIAVGLEQASFGVDLKKEIQTLNLGDALNRLKNYVAGASGEVSDNELKSFKQLFTNISKNIEKQPQFAEQEKSLQSAKRIINYTQNELSKGIPDEFKSTPLSGKSGIVNMGNVNKPKGK